MRAEPGNAVRLEREITGRLGGGEAIGEIFCCSRRDEPRGDCAVFIRSTRDIFVARDERRGDCAVTEQ
jgi:hypothetical protein